LFNLVLLLLIARRAGRGGHNLGNFAFYAG
jgi:hypothetical protein